MIIQRKPGRATPRNGVDFDKFSDFMYSFRSEANNGFTFTDVDGVFRNYLKRTIAILEVKTFKNDLPFHQRQLFEQLDGIFRNGITDGWTYKGSYKLIFQRTCFADGLAWLNDRPITEDEFIFFLKVHF